MSCRRPGVSLYILVHFDLAIAVQIYRIYRYFKMTETQTTLSLSKEEGGYYNSIYAINSVAHGVAALLKMVMDKVARRRQYDLIPLRGSWAFNIFAMTTDTTTWWASFSEAQYIATERGYVLQNANMVVLYGLYAVSPLLRHGSLLPAHLVPHEHRLPKSLLYSWSVWSFAVSSSPRGGSHPRARICTGCNEVGRIGQLARWHL